MKELTPDAVASMLKGTLSPLKTPVIVKIVPKNDSTGFVVFDGKEHAAVTLVPPASRSFFHKQPCRVLIKSYIFSEANYGSQQPFLCIADLEILETLPAAAFGSPQLPVGNPATLKADKVHGCRAPTFFSKYAAYLSNDELSGSHPPNRDIDDFLQQNKSMKTLPAHSGPVLEHYQAAVSEFQNAQIDRQNASLTTNANKEDEHRSKLVIAQHALALQTAMQQTDRPLRTSMLQEWHGILCHEIHAESGRLRTRRVRVGLVHFSEANLAPQLDTLCQALDLLKQRLVTGNPVHIATFAAAVFLGIVDVHAFADGNGRLARIGLNWALRKAGVPFCLHLFATPVQRAEYTHAVIATRQNICLVTRGSVSDEMLWQALASTTVLQPLVGLILDRWTKAVIEFHSLWQEKSALASEQLEVQAARKFRERAAASQCIICLDETPNIATLCCGKAVHLNCMAEWLSNRNSCPQCRAELPALPQRLRAPSASQEENDTTSESDRGVIVLPHQLARAMGLDETTTYDEEDTVTDGGSNHHDPTEMQGAETSAQNLQLHSETIEIDQDDTTSYADNGMDATTSSTTYSPSMNLPPICTRNTCRNRSARDCDNGCCGRCCVLYGQYRCARHHG